MEMTSVVLHRCNEGVTGRLAMAMDEVAQALCQAEALHQSDSG